MPSSQPCWFRCAGSSRAQTQILWLVNDRLPTAKVHVLPLVFLAP